MEIIIFYSWQSDKPSTINKNLIQNAAEKAINRMHKDVELRIELSLDRDTKNVPGSPEIARTILEKIEKSHIFLCDVTIITKGKKPTPNPNVLIELGYAAAKLGWERIICVINDHYGNPELLPFDLRHRRWPIAYTALPSISVDEKSKTRDNLSREIEKAIRDVVQSGLITSKINPKDKRVARQFGQILIFCLSNISNFVQDYTGKHDFLVFQTDYDDLPETNYPNPEPIGDILDAFRNHSLLNLSNQRQGDYVFTWAESFISDFQELSLNCEKILNRYADRDDELISMIEDIQSRASAIAATIRITLTAPELAGFYDNGVPENHIEIVYQYFLLSILKSQRIIRKFGGE
jgi:hypothetical protein